MSRREWIEEYARTELGMAPPKPEQMASEGDLDALVGEPNSLAVKTPETDLDGEAPE